MVPRCLHGFARFRMFSRGFAWSSMVLREFARFREVSQGLGCFCVVLHGFARFWVFLLGSVLVYDR